ncbi:MAG: hypothetical protein JRM78_00385 [Nitrososphaerota archaeon]|jgi:hypothetical protein|nr:hypothetical protein [Nitrososphaerota archaeon]MDG7039801.1 hypothetical protein [Nitrososphaerota archaeon]MDG7043360.1 hypothetical protein [Nitrososphaerota archaeon]
MKERSTGEHSGRPDGTPDLSRFVFVLDEGGVFKAPIDKIWRLHASPEHVHPSAPDAMFEQVSENVTYIHSTLIMQDGARVKNKIRLTAYPPIGFAFEWLEGLFAGSKEFSFYIPQGKETGVTSVGYWTSPVLELDKVKPAVLKLMDTLYEEDQVNLTKMK